MVNHCNKYFHLSRLHGPLKAFQWLSLIGTIWLQCINGTNSNFPAYSSQLKQLLSISQVQLNNLVFASDAGKIFGWISGIAAAHLPLWVVLIFGSGLGLVGYGVQYLFITNQISSSSYLHVFLLTVLAGNSICWINTVGYIVTIKNFPLDRQVAVGISTSYVGLSAKIFTDVVDVVAPSSADGRAKAYLLLNAIVPLMVCMISAPFIREVNVAKSRKLASGFIVLFVITIATGIYAVICSLSPTISLELPRSIAAITMGVFLLAPFVVPVAEQIRETMQKNCRLRREMRVHALTPEQENRLTITGSGFESLEDPLEMENTRQVFEVGVREEIGVRLMLRRVDFWLYFFAYFFGATIGLVYLNNLGQIAESRGSLATSSLVSLSSAFGFFGRLIPSLLDYYLSKRRYMISRRGSIAAMTAPMCGAFFLLINKSSISLHISTGIIGVCTGAITSISVSTTTELFGTKNFGINHNVLVVNIPIGSFLFGYMAALLYNRAEGNASEGSCLGAMCYQTTFIVWGSLCFFGTLLALVLHVRNKKFYAQRA